MKRIYYHGSSVLFDTPLEKGRCVSSELCNALKFALRRGQPECYIYKLSLDPQVDLEQSTDTAGTIDLILIQATPFVQRMLVTEELKAGCQAKAKSKAAELA